MPSRQWIQLVVNTRVSGIINRKMYTRKTEEHFRIDGFMKKTGSRGNV